MHRKHLAVTFVLVTTLLLTAMPVARAVSVEAAGRRLGRFTRTDATPRDCPAGAQCHGFRVTCPGLEAAADGFLATRRAPAGARGVVTLFSGGDGVAWWSPGTAAATAFLNGLHARGLQTVQVRWQDPWLEAAPGETAGPAALACRSATVIQWVHDNVYLPLAAPARATGSCGFCVTGNSGGSSQVSYALSHYGLDSILDAVVPTSGPPHAALAKGCQRNAGDGPYWYSRSASRVIDRSYGFLSGGGPCERHQPAFARRWQADAVDTGGSDYHHPATQVHFIFGGNDATVAPEHGQDYRDRLQAARSPIIATTSVAAAGHRIQDSTAGLDTLKKVLLR